MPLTDELCSAIEVLQGPAIDEDGSSRLVLALVLLAVPQAVATAIEARLLLFVWRRAKARALAVSLAATGAGFALVAAYPPAMPFALLLCGPWQGLSGAIGQATLVAGRDPERAMARWAVGGAVGDVGGPVLLGAIAWLGGGFPLAFGVLAVMFFVQAACAFGTRSEVDAGEDELPDSLGELLRELWADRPLVRALAAASLCTLLDELFLVFGALWLDAQGWSTAAIAGAFAAEAAAVVGASLLVEPAAERFGGERVLAGSAVVAAVAFALWLATANPVALALLGAATAFHYPLAEARAYAVATPARVAAGAHVFGVFDAVWPVVVGLCADAFGLDVAMLVFFAQPAGLWIATRSPGASPRRTPR